MRDPGGVVARWRLTECRPPSRRWGGYIFRPQRYWARDVHGVRGAAHHHRRRLGWAIRAGDKKPAETEYDGRAEQPQPTCRECPHKSPPCLRRSATALEAL